MALKSLNTLIIAKSIHIEISGLWEAKNSGSRDEFDQNTLYTCL
jgi:hypothetical protein